MRASETTVTACSASSPPTPDVLIVGAGLAGLPVAWELLRRGASVRIIDRDRPGRATSYVAAGMLAPVTEVEPDDPEHLTLSLTAWRRWEPFAAALREASGHPLPLRGHGTLALARDRDEAEALIRFQAVCDRLDLPAVRLLPSAARRLEPGLAPTLRAALEVSGDRAVDPRELVAALVTAIEDAGALVETTSPVRQLRVEAGRVVGVELEDGTAVRAGAVVLAAGPWSGTLAGVPEPARIPVRPVKGQLLMLRDPEGPGRVQRTLRFGSSYLVPRDDGRYVLGATTEEQGFDRTTTAWAVHDLLRDGAELVPGLLDLQVEETLAGLRPTLPDGRPAVGPSPVLDGLWWSTGHGRNGVLFASLAGAVLAERLAGSSGSRDLADARPLVDPARFVGTAPATGAPALPAGSTPPADLAELRTLVDPARVHGGSDV